MEHIINKYKSQGFKLTPQRLAILMFLEGNTSHPTAEAIYSEIKKVHPTVSFATVYNTIQALRERGLVSEITIDPERKHFDPNPAPHHHIICTACNRIIDVMADYSETLTLPGDILDQFTVTGTHVDFFGVCVDCRS
ncbi:MAG: transcriptional repressor [Deltaproteobacteria bacterium]|nr:transcriptional repressor [Deltaproteobacteria bacterium]